MRKQPVRGYVGCTTTLRAGVFLMAALVNGGSLCQGSWNVIGPTPYLSKADSPFPVDGSNPNFYLEGFEDGLLNTPGVFQPLLPITHAAVINPGIFTDSVDADDGVIDADGQSGHSLASNAFMTDLLFPPTSWSFIRLGFELGQLGFYPNSFGFVWTDGVAPNNVLIEVFDAEWKLLAQNEFQGLGDADLTGQTAEDRFLGVIAPVPFAYVQITSRYAGAPYTFEIDHVQYGLIEVPEPSTVVLTLTPILIAFWIIFQTRRGVLRKSD